MENKILITIKIKQNFTSYSIIIKINSRNIVLNSQSIQFLKIIT